MLLTWWHGIMFAENSAVELSLHLLTEHVWWGLAVTAHTFTSLHVDSDGFSTFVQVMCGKKVWIVYHPSPGLLLWSTNLFTNGEWFQLDKIPKNAQYGLEAMVLRPGDQLYFSLYLYLLLSDVCTG